MNTITVYSKSDGSCIQCKFTEKVLDKSCLSYTTLDLLDPIHHEEAVSLGFFSAPVVLVKDPEGTIIHSWSGYRPDFIKKLVTSGVLTPAQALV